MPQRGDGGVWQGDAFAGRTPRLLLRIVGALLLRFADRAFAAVLLKLPPRLTRFEAPVARPRLLGPPPAPQRQRCPVLHVCRDRTQRCGLLAFIDHALRALPLPTQNAPTRAPQVLGPRPRRAAVQAKAQERHAHPARSEDGPRSLSVSRSGASFSCTPA